MSGKSGKCGKSNQCILKTKDLTNWDYFDSETRLFQLQKKKDEGNVILVRLNQGKFLKTDHLIRQGKCFKGKQQQKETYMAL